MNEKQTKAINDMAEAIGKAINYIAPKAPNDDEAMATLSYLMRAIDSLKKAAA